MSFRELNGQLTRSDVKVAELYHDFPNNPYHALDDFRQEWNSQNNNTRIFYSHNRRVFIDKCIFFGFSLFFLFLGIVVFFKTTNWACSIYFSNCQAVKAVSCVICLVLSVTAFWIGSTICAKKHAVNELVSKAKKGLLRYFRQKQIELGLLHCNNTEKKQAELVFKQAYHNSRDRVVEAKEDALKLFERINHWPALDVSMRENLLNQTILELNDKLNEIMNNFKMDLVVVK